MIHQQVVADIGAYINRIKPVNDENVADFVGHARKRVIKKNELFLREGEVCNELLFVHNGAFRYFITKDGDDFTKDFCLDIANPFCTGYSSFLTGLPSAINIEALEDSIVSVWSRKYIHELFDREPWTRFARAIAEMLYLRKEEREISFLRASAEERYQQFIREFKDVTQRVAQYHIASYLGITPESLSRIRKKLARTR